MLYVWAAGWHPALTRRGKGYAGRRQHLLHSVARMRRSSSPRHISCSRTTDRHVRQTCGSRARRMPDVIMGVIGGIGDSGKAKLLQVR